MRVRPEALAVWDASDEDARRALIDHAMARVTLECEAAVARGWAYVVHPPEIEVVRAREPSIATIASNFRSYFQAQSGSDWGEHVHTIIEVFVDNGAVIECELHRTESNVTESESDDYDDAAASRHVIDRWLRNGAVTLDRAIAAAQQRNGDATVEVIRVRPKVIATAAVARGVVTIEETRTDTLESMIVLETSGPHREVIAGWLQREARDR